MTTLAPCPLTPWRLVVWRPRLRPGPFPRPPASERTAPPEVAAPAEPVVADPVLAVPELSKPTPAAPATAAVTPASARAATSAPGRRTSSSAVPAGRALPRLPLAIGGLIGVLALVA